MRRIEKVHSSSRLGSGADPALVYEFLHVRLEGGEDAVVIQMVNASQPAIALPARIPLRDLKEVEETLLLFMESVRKKSGDETSLERAFFTMGIAPRSEEEHAVFRSDPTPAGGARPPTAVNEILISSGPRKGYYDPKAAAAAAAAESAAAAGAGAAAGLRAAPVEEPPPKIISFTLAQPPTVEEIIRELQADMRRLVVVARKEMAGKVQAYLDAVLAGNQEVTKKPGEFEAVIVPRKGGKHMLKMKMGAPLAHGIVDIVSNPTKVLWIPADEPK